MNASGAGVRLLCVPRTRSTTARGCKPLLVASGAEAPRPTRTVRASDATVLGARAS